VSVVAVQDWSPDEELFGRRAVDRRRVEVHPSRRPHGFSVGLKKGSTGQGILKGEVGGIAVPLTSCLTGLD
jgi:hypothetical protein